MLSKDIVVGAFAVLSIGLYVMRQHPRIGLGLILTSGVLVIFANRANYYR